jgi:putative SOS response-associated peptidase YedK
VCGRYSLAAPNPAYLRERFGLGEDSPLEPRFNIAPSQDAVAVTTDREGAPRPDVLRWGLVPHWADSPKTGFKMINARAETLEQRPAFRDALATRRCLVIADGFYEWQPREHTPKQPWWITLEGGEPFAFAGLWALWRPEPDVEPLRSFTIITTAANERVGALHDRMPVILPRNAERAWLEHDTPRAELMELLQPLPDNATALTPVSTAVNDVNYDGPDCIRAVEPVPDEPREQSLF